MLLYILPVQEKNEQVKFFADRVTLGSLSMRSLWIQSGGPLSNQKRRSNRIGVSNS
jgi:hypothetical protein